MSDIPMKWMVPSGSDFKDDGSPSVQLLAPNEFETCFRFIANGYTKRFCEVNCKKTHPDRRSPKIFTVPVNDKDTDTKYLVIKVPLKVIKPVVRDPHVVIPEPKLDEKRFEEITGNVSQKKKKKENMLKKEKKEKEVREKKRQEIVKQNEENIKNGDRVTIGTSLSDLNNWLETQNLSVFKGLDTHVFYSGRKRKEREGEEDRHVNQFNQKTTPNPNPSKKKFQPKKQSFGTFNSKGFNPKGGFNGRGPGFNGPGSKV